MKPIQTFLPLLFAVISVSNAEYIPLGGPVYINPNAASSQSFESETQNEPGEKITQTVYGFLDFTTTIGNTVMVFSPQSAAPAPEKKTEKPTEKPAVIETKSTQQPESEIKPSKTVKTEKKSSVKKPEEPKPVFSVVEVIEGDVKPSSVVEIKTGPTILSSKVEVKESPPIKIKKNQKPFAKVEVRDENNQIISSQVQIQAEPTVLSSIVEIISNDKPKILSSIVEVKTSSDEEPAIEVDANNIDKPEYDFLNRQPSEVVDESYRVIDLKPNSNKFHLKPKTRPQGQSGKEGKSNGQKTGLITKFGGTVVKEGVTTVHETQLIGTYISGNYHEVLESTSKILPKVQKISPSQTTRILKTAAPNFAKGRAHLEPTPAGSLHEETALPLEALFHGDKSSNLIRPSRRPGPAVGGPSGKNDFKNKYRSRNYNRDQEISEEYENSDETENQTSGYKKSRGRGTSTIKPSFRFGSNNRFGKTSSVSQVSTVSVYSEDASVSPAGRKYQSSNRRSNGGYKSKNKEYGAHDKEDGYTRRSFKPKIQTTAVDNSNSGTSLYKFKLQRPSGRWTYKTTPKPRVIIRGRQEQNENEVSTPLTTPHPQYTPESDELSADRREDSDDYDNGSADKTERPEPTPTASTIRATISTPADFSDVYYEIATIKSPYVYQAGNVINTRYITVTSTFEKTIQSVEPTLAVLPSLTEPLTENILATAPVYDKEHNLPIDSSIATLPPIALGTDVETPPLETKIETFSTTQDLLKTHILPVIRGGNDTTLYTLVQSYHVTRFVTATKTLPPMEVYQFVPSKTLNEFNTRLEEAGSELHLELDFGDENNSEDDEDHPPAIRAFPPDLDLDLANVGNDFDISSADDSKLSEALRKAKKLKSAPKPTTEAPTTTTPAMTPEQIQQLALLRFLNPAAANLPQVITSSKPIIKVETIFESHLVPLIIGQSTTYSTLSRPVSTVSKTEYELVTSTIAAPLPPVPINPLNPFAQPQFQITSAPIVTSTSVTATESKVLKLTFGAKTAYTTLYSTRVVPTVLTTYLTTSVPVVPTAAAFPGFFPGPFGAYPGYVG